MIRILLGDDHAVLRAGLKALMATAADLEVAGEAADGSEVVRLAVLLRPDVVLLDVTMPGNEQFAALRGLRERSPDARVLLLTMHEDKTLLREGLRLGALGYVLKKAAESELFAAIRAVAGGNTYVDSTMTRVVIEDYLRADAEPRRPSTGTDGLTARETEVLTLTAEGYTNKEIAARLFISVKTVETHKAHIAEKLGSKSRVDWLRYARQRSLLPK